MPLCLLTKDGTLYGPFPSRGAILDFVAEQGERGFSTYELKAPITHDTKAALEGAEVADSVNGPA